MCLIEIDPLAFDHQGAASNLVEDRNGIFAEQPKEQHLNATKEEYRNYNRRRSLRSEIEPEQLQEEKAKSIQKAQKRDSKSGKKGDSQRRATETNNAVQSLIDQLPKPVSRDPVLAWLPFVRNTNRAKPRVK